MTAAAAFFEALLAVIVVEFAFVGVGEDFVGEGSIDVVILTMCC